MVDSDKTQLILDHLYLVKDFIRIKIHEDELPAVIDKSDLYQVGVITLIKTARRYKDDGRAVFSTYADKCIRPAIYGYITDMRFGPKKAQASRNKLKGIKGHPDMVSYDAIKIEKNEEALPNKQQHSIWFDKNYMSRLSKEEISAVLKQTIRILKQKVDSRNKFGAAGVHYSPRDNNYRAEVNYFKKKFSIGRYETAEEAGEARKEFLNRVKEYCEERL